MAEKLARFNYAELRGDDVCTAVLLSRKANSYYPRELAIHVIRSFEVFLREEEKSAGVVYRPKSIDLTATVTVFPSDSL